MNRKGQNYTTFIAIFVALALAVLIIGLQLGWFSDAEDDLADLTNACETAGGTCVEEGECIEQFAKKISCDEEEDKPICCLEGIIA